MPLAFSRQAAGSRPGCEVALAALSQLQKLATEDDRLRAELVKVACG